jgi:hypothetical protein
MPDDPAEPDGGHSLRWPAGFSPECADVWARSELVINAAPAVVFSYLASTGRWAEDFSGLHLDVQVIEFVAGRRLAWSGQGIDISVYHAWVIAGNGGRSRVLAGWSARGAAAIALRETDPAAAQRMLDRWVTDLKTAAENARR